MNSMEMVSLNQNGFTFVEMIVSIAVFSLTLLAVSDIFLRAQQAQRTSAALESLQADGRFVINKISQEIRGGSIDYGYYTEANLSLASSVATLALVSSDGRKLRFSSSTAPASCAERTNSSTNTPCILISDDGEGGCSVVFFYHHPHDRSVCE
jgi:prepilin-type N-terminal cleavage/methylation domain-containing protein